MGRAAKTRNSQAIPNKLPLNSQLPNSPMSCINWGAILIRRYGTPPKKAKTYEAIRHKRNPLGPLSMDASS
jgi:hypothetical protein